MPAGPLEKDTCRDYVLPLLKAAHWSDDQIQDENAGLIWPHFGGVALV